MSRIPYPDMDKLSPVKLDGVGYPDRLLLNVTKIALHAPEGLWKGHYALKQACIHGTEMDDKLREILILRIGFLCKSEYEIFHHNSISANLGFTDQQRADIRDGKFDTFTPAEQALLQFTTEAIVDHDCKPETMANIKAHYNESEILEMLILIASYVGTAIMAGALGLDCDTESVKSWK